jgi:hypothetical protein
VRDNDGHPYLGLTDELLRELIAEVRGLRADLRRQSATVDLRAAWLEEIGPAPMTSAGLLRFIEDDPHGGIAVAVAGLVDLSASGRAISLGRLLARQPWLDSTDRGGVLMYRLHDGD